MTVVEQDGQTLAFVPVTIAGHGPYPFVLDTGASTSVVDDDIAAELHLPRTGQTRSVSGVASTEKVPFVRVPDWQVDDVRLAPGDAAVINLDAQGRAGTQGIKGLLGSDVLRRFGQVTIDYSGRVLRLPAS